MEASGAEEPKHTDHDQINSDDEVQQLRHDKHKNAGYE